jgi:hypothetical protein
MWLRICLYINTSTSLKGGFLISLSPPKLKKDRGSFNRNGTGDVTFLDTKKDPERALKEPKVFTVFGSFGTAFRQMEQEPTVF